MKHSTPEDPAADAGHRQPNPLGPILLRFAALLTLATAMLTILWQR